MKALSTAAILCMTASLSAEPVRKNEAYYRDLLAIEVGGKVEQQMGDGTRCDIITDTHAIEVDWASKWKEGIGQALWYGFQSNRPAKLALIVRNQRDRVHVLRCRSLIEHNGLALEVIVVEEN